jgi:ubiquinone/menaquinone biosynthesis C-methylase UbiE/uncharacterized protein YbaR (Trm112 family)
MKEDLALNTRITLVCPQCKVPLSILDNEYRCHECEQYYPVTGGLPHLLSAVDDELKAKQKKAYEENVSKTSPEQIEIDRGGFSYPTTLKLAKIRKILTSVNLFPKASVLDVGCGDGRMLNKLVAQYQIKGQGVDISSNQLKENLRNNPFGNIFYLSDAERLPFGDNTFDFIFCFDVLEHLSSPQACINEICRTLKKDRKALIYVISRKDKYTWHWFLRKVSGKKLGVDKGEFGDHQRENFLQPEEVMTFFRAANAKVKRVIYFHSFFTLAFDELSKYLSSKYKDSSKSEDNQPLNREVKKKRDASGVKVPVPVKLWAILVNILLGPLELCDKIWSQRGYSNGFFVEIEKNSNF